MKKLLALILASLLIFALASCTNDDAVEDGNNDEVIESPAEDDTPAEDETPAEDDTTVEDETPAGETPANALLAEFKNLMATSEDKSPEFLANTLITNPIIPFMGGAMAVEEGFLQGFTVDITGFESGAVFMPMIGAIPFIGYVFELAEDADVDAFVQTLKDNADMRWLICAAAEETVCEAVDNTVFFCMAKTSFAE